MNTTAITRLVVTHKGELTKASARDLRAAVRKAGVRDDPTSGTWLDAITAHMPIELALEALDALEDQGYFVGVEVIAYADLTPAQRGAVTRKRNTRLAKKAARKATPSTGYVKEQIRARKSA